MTPNPTSDYARVERAIRFLDERRASHPSLAAVAQHVGLSPSHFQRLFSRWAGISPKRFVQFQTAELLKPLLRDRRSVLDASLEAGLSGPSRVHDLILNAEAVTPGDYATAGAGLVIRYGFHPSPFGEAFVAATPNGLCHLAFIDPVSRADAVSRLRHEWPVADLRADQDGTRALVARAFPAPGESPRGGLALHVKGTNFQLRVWRALLAIPDGGLTTYGAVAAAIGDPAGSRAVGNAVGSNPVSWLIPCHRVLRSTGALGGYAWGVDRKRTMLAYESVRTGELQPRAGGRRSAVIGPGQASRRLAAVG